MSEAQKQQVRRLVEREVEIDLTVAHHGDCIGADVDFHAIARECGLAVVGHIPVIEEHRAFCEFDDERAPLTYMKRNAQIVAESDVVIATPFESTEQSRGGTWRTVQLARKAKRHLFIVWPDGRVSEERYHA